MDRRNYSDLGEEIRDIVQSAVNTMDFHQLNRDIGNTVRGALDEVRHSLGTGYGGYRPNNPDGAGDNWNPNNGGKDYRRDDKYRWDRENRRESRHQNRDYRWDASYQNGQANSTNSKNQQQSYNQQNNRTSQNPSMNGSASMQGTASMQGSAYTQGAAYVQSNTAVSKQTKPFPCVPVGRVSGILLTVFGSIGLGAFGIGAAVLAIIGQVTSEWGLFGTISMGLLLFFGISWGMMAIGGRLRKRLARYRRYIGLFGGHAYYSIKELAASVGQSPKFVLKDLRRMITIGMFPEGRIDDQGTCVMLNRETYSQYLELQKNLRIQAEDKGKLQNNQENKKDQEASSNQTAQNQQVKQAVDAGMACIQEIREANDAIPGEEISRKLDRLEDVIGKIFRHIEQHPDQLDDIRKFMEYYLPTTLKLVHAYKEFDKQSIQGENITSAKKEIEETLDTINLAFENLLDSLFEDAAMDVSGDISVLETLLAQEGLTKKDFVSKE